MTEVAWLLIEPGWKVVASDGSEIGKVHEVVGDSGKDIFDGLAVSSGILGKPRYIPSEQVGRITEGQIEVDIPSAEAQHLEEYDEPPPSEEILPESASRWQRFRAWFGGS
jgi:PRC-barrel domain protein